TSAFFLYYDSSGGWYDHVPPSTQDGAQLGPRVPALLVSPYATPGTVDHRVLDSGAVLKFVESNWSVAPLTIRDRDAASLASAFSFHQAARAPALLDGQGGAPTLVRPNSPLIYASYTLALTAVALAAGWGILSQRRKHVTEARSR